MKVIFDPILGKLRADYPTAVGGAVNSVNSGAYITVDNTDPANPIVNFSGTVYTPPIEAANYSALPNPTTVAGKTYIVLASQGTKWLPGSLGGTYYPKGFYYSDGSATWVYSEVPYNATQGTVDTGTNDDQFVTPKTFTNASKWGLYQLLSGKDASNGYAGLTLFKINFRNALNTFTSFLTNSNTAARTYTFQDRDGTIADDTDLATKQSISAKDASGGYVGLTLFKINFKNVLNTFTSFFTNSNTASRTYTFQDRDGTIADNTDLAAKADASLVLLKDGTVALTGNWDAGAFNIISKLFTISGTGGNGFMEYIAQSSNAAAPSSTGFRLFAGSAGSFNWVRKNGADTYVRTFDATLTANRTWTLQDSSDTIVMRATTDTLTNKRLQSRAGTVTSSATPTINTDNVDYFSITALATNITSFTTNLSGTPSINDTLWLAITDNGTARTLTWGASFEASGTISLPTTTVISTRLDVGFVWNEVTNKWRICAVQ